MPTRLIEMIVTSAGELSASGMLLRLSLAAISMFAMVHLLSLWGTRYGDNNTVSKSFFLSLVLHGVACLGWATVAESYPKRSISTESPEVQIPITFVDTVDQAPQPGKNKLPIFESGLASKDLPLLRDPHQLTRSDRDHEVPDVDSPQWDKAPEAKLLPDMPDFASQAEDQASELESPTVAMSRSVASSTMLADQPALEARPEISAKATASRTKVSRTDLEIDAVPSTGSKTGASVRATTLIEDGLMMTLPSEVATDAQIKPMGIPNDEMIRRQGSPNPSLVVDNVAGSGADGNNRLAGSSSPRRAERTNRPATRPGNGSDEMTIRPSAVNNSSSTARAADDRMLASRSAIESADESPQPSFEKPKAPSMSRAPARAPETYQARSQGQRMSSVLKHGGSEESERAVENSLKWLASVQEPNGRWSSSRHGGGAVETDPQGQQRLDGGKRADSGVTGLVVLSFLGAGYTHDRGRYTEEVRRALDWLIAQQRPEGQLAGDATKYDQNYCHAMATFALAEAYAMQKDANDYPELRSAVKRGVKWIAGMQNDDGGWRYGRGTESDMSMFGWQLMALKSAVNGGIPVPEETRRGMVKFLDARGQGQHGGLAGYKRVDPPTPAMTAEALFCRQMFTIRTNDAASQEAVAYLRRHLPRVTVYDEYYWYYGTLAMHHLDDESWQEWNNALRDMLITMQRQEGPLAGSWDPRGKWAGIGGRLYSTALSTMCLEVYYRYQSSANPTNGQ